MRACCAIPVIFKITQKVCAWDSFLYKIGCFFSHLSVHQVERFCVSITAREVLCFFLFSLSVHIALTCAGNECHLLMLVETSAASADSHVCSGVVMLAWETARGKQEENRAPTHETSLSANNIKLLSLCVLLLPHIHPHHHHTPLCFLLVLTVKWCRHHQTSSFWVNVRNNSSGDKCTQFNAFFFFFTQKPSCVFTCECRFHHTASTQAAEIQWRWRTMVHEVRFTQLQTGHEETGRNMELQPELFGFYSSRKSLFMATAFETKRCTLCLFLEVISVKPKEALH